MSDNNEENPAVEPAEAPDNPEAADAEPAAESQADSEAPAAADEPAEPKDPIAELQAEVEKWKDTAVRGKAELENLRKRMAREKTDAIKYGNSALIESLLPVIDNFMMGLEAARLESEDSIVFQGMQMVFKQIEDFLSNQGVEVAAAEPGQAFDPQVHEAVSQQPSDEVAEGSIIAVVRRGYKLHDRLIRAANVVVSTGAEQPAQDEAAPAETTESEA